MFIIYITHDTSNCLNNVAVTEFSQYSLHLTSPWLLLPPRVQTTVGKHDNPHYAYLRVS